MHTPLKFRNLWQAVIAALLLNGMFLLVAPYARADEHDRCRHRIERAETRLNHEVARHGEHSRQAEEKRHQLHEERERCWNQYHGWWDGHENRWHTEHDFDIVVSH